VLCDPLVVLAPLQEPEAVQLVALLVAHVNCEAEPDATFVGEAPNVSVGAPGAAIVTEADRVTVPPAPVHARV
jgi:hypothetical protein